MENKENVIRNLFLYSIFKEFMTKNSDTCFFCGSTYYSKNWRKYTITVAFDGSNFIRVRDSNGDLNESNELYCLIHFKRAIIQAQSLKDNIDALLK